MAQSTAEITLEITPKARLDIIDVSGRIYDRSDAFLSQYRKALYCSYHTTAGYLEENLVSRLNHSPDGVQTYLRTFQHLFPEGANYQHDQLQLRTELTDEQRGQEPRNADSHLTYIGSGLASCVTYSNQPGHPVYFIDLDGLNGTVPRRRQTTIIGFNRCSVAAEARLTVPVSSHPIDSINLRDQRVGLFDALQELVDRHEIVRGRLDLSLAPEERNTGLTVNEYETLLMRHDLAEVLRDPLRFMTQKGRGMLRDPRAIPGKAKNYAKYDLVHVVNELIDAFGMSETLVERIIDKFLAVPASRFLRMKRSVSLLITDRDASGRGSIVQGLYQSPILVQWKKASAGARALNVRLVRFE